MNHLGLVLFTTLIISLEASYPKCMYIDYRGRNLTEEINSVCKEKKICNKHFKISRVNIPPYSNTKILESVLQQCCGRCLTHSISKDFVHITEMPTTSVASKFDFIFPLLGESSEKQLYGHHFIPISQIPHLFYITAKEGSVVKKFLKHCLDLYPLILFCIIMAIISGFVVWVIELFAKDSEFPRTFASGVFEGFWFSVVSMTTLGYGDRVVRSTAAKMYCVCWILVGIILFSSLTSLLTAEIIDAFEPSEKSMTGLRVGALHLRNYDTMLIINHGGIIVQTSAASFLADINTLITMLRTNQINGFVLDRYTLGYVSDYLQTDDGQDELFKQAINSSLTEINANIDFFHTCTHRSIKHGHDKDYSYGILVKNIDDYHYFHDAIHDNQLVFNTLIKSNMNRIIERVRNDFFSSSSAYLMENMKYIWFIIGFILLFGIIYEVYVRKVLWSYIKDPPAESLQTATSCSLPSSSFASTSF